MKDHRISVLHFSNSRAFGGAEQHILTLLRGLDRTRFAAAWACPPEIAAIVEHEVPDDVPIFKTELRSPSQIRIGFAFSRMLRQRRVDILHCHQFRATAAALVFARMSPVPVIIETPHIREHWRAHGIKSSFIVDRLVSRSVDHYIAVSDANSRYLIEQKRFPPSKITVIHNGCDLSRFSPRRESALHLRELVGAHPNDPLVIVVGRLEEQKGHRVLLSAWPEVLRRFPNSHLVCLGEGSLRAELKAISATAGLGDSVRFLGQRHDIVEWLATADLMVLPSFYEGLPIVAVEALASGCPVVASAVDGTPEIILDGKTGLTVPAGDVEALSNAICKLVGDRGLARRFSDAGREWVGKNFDQKQQVTKTQELYAQTLALKNSRADRDVQSSVDFNPASVLNNGQAQAETYDQAGLQLYQEVVSTCTRKFHDELVGIILTGSLARNEGTFVKSGTAVRIDGDAEFLLIFGDQVTLPSTNSMTEVARGIEQALRRSNITVAGSVTLVPTHTSYFRKLKPHIFAYELSSQGRVLWGDANLLSLIPPFDASRIPFEDAWQLLCNRIIELLECAEHSPISDCSIPPEMFYRTMKLWLDMATSLLVFAGGYRPSYRERSSALTALAMNCRANGPWPFDLFEFSRIVNQCTDWKLSPGRTGSLEFPVSEFASGYDFWEKSVSYAHQLWRWELTRMTTAPAESSDQELFDKFRRRQSVVARVRGWLHVIRSQGWHRSWRQWPRWSRRMLQASPRYWIYGAAGELFFSLPDLVQCKSESSRNENWERVCRRLPVDSIPRNGAIPQQSWKRAALGIVSNYHQFLVSTRS